MSDDFDFDTYDEVIQKTVDEMKENAFETLRAFCEARLKMEPDEYNKPLPPEFMPASLVKVRDASITLGNPMRTRLEARIICVDGIERTFLLMVEQWQATRDEPGDYDEELEVFEDW